MKYKANWKTATESNFNNYSKLASHSKSNPMGMQATTSHLSTALNQHGLPDSWVKPLLELTARESSWKPTAQNPSSTAYGLFQFLNSTWKDYGYVKTSDPVKQAIAGVDYVKKRYGDPWKALAFHDQNNWY